MAAEHESGWPDLPADLLGLVLRRLPSPADRIRLGAVCRGISSSIKLLPPFLQLPWIVLQDGTLFDLSSNVPVYQLRLPGDAICYSAGENMFFLLHNDGRCSLMNALSGDMTPLPELAAVLGKYNMMRQDDVTKVVMSESSPNHGPIIALLARRRVILSTCRPTSETNSCLDQEVLALIHDMAFFQGKLYVICAHRLIAFELNGRLDKPTPPGVKPECICGTIVVEGLNDKLSHVDWTERYLVESNGKLLVAMLRIEHTYGGHHGMDVTSKCFCEVWEADMSDRRWKKVDAVDGSLDGRALFVSSPCSKSVPVAVDGLHGARQDCIYFLHRRNRSSVYNMRTKTFTPLPQDLTPLLHELAPPLEVGRFPLRPKSDGRFPTWFSHGSSTLATYFGKVRHRGEGSRLVQNQGGPEPQCSLFHQRILFACHDWIRKWDFVD